jgi:hypothetical protein
LWRCNLIPTARRADYYALYACVVNCLIHSSI